MWRGLAEQLWAEQLWAEQLWAEQLWVGLGTARVQLGAPAAEWEAILIDGLMLTKLKLKRTVLPMIQIDRDRAKTVAQLRLLPSLQFSSADYKSLMGQSLQETSGTYCP
jgi:hypothetical protein